MRKGISYDGENCGGVTVHRCPLESICKCCGQAQYVFSPRSQPGYCSRCQCWLGREPEPIECQISEPVRIAEMVAELLAMSPRLPAGFGLDQFRENMRNLRVNREFHRAVRRRKVTRRMNVGHAPRMDSLVRLSLGQNGSMLQLLTERITVTRPDSNPHAHFRIAGSIIEETLNGALRDDGPQSLAEIATHLGYQGVESLQRRFPDLCDEIVRRRQAVLKRSPAPPTVPLPRERIESALSEALHQGGPVSLHSLHRSAFVTSGASTRASTNSARLSSLTTCGSGNNVWMPWKEHCGRR